MEKSTRVQQNPRYDWWVTPRNTRNLPAVLLVFGVLFLATSCKSSKMAGRAARASNACIGACEQGLQVAREIDEPQCKSSCIARLVGSGAYCEGVLLAWIECELAQNRSRTRDDNIGEQSTSALGCNLERRLASLCEARCREVGTLRSGEIAVDAVPESTVRSYEPSSGANANRRAIAYELRDCGCGSCPTEPGASAGAACTAAKVCAEQLVVCDGGLGRHSIRVCAKGRCADAQTASALVLRIPVGSACQVGPFVQKQ